jgi:zinc protease
MIRKMIAVAAALLVSLPILAQKQEPPAPGAPKNFNLPAPRTFALPNGMQVTFVQWGTVPKARVELAVSTGNVHEGPAEVWLADVTGDLIEQGTTSRTATQVAEEAARMGGSVNLAVGLDATELGGEVLSEFADDLVTLMADVIRNPRLPESEIERIKADRARQLAIARSSPQQLGLERFRSVLYPGHPYGRLFPTAEMLQSYTIAQVRDFYSRNFGAARAHLYVAGRFDEAAVEQAVRAGFGDWAAGPAIQRNPPKAVSARSLNVVERPGAVQSTIYLGLPTIDPSQQDWVTLGVTNALLGGYFSSRITSNIREAKGYTYSPFSTLSSRYRDAYWAQVADVTTNVTGASLKEIFYEIQRLRTEPPPAAELRAVQNYIAGTFTLQNSSRTGIINQLQFMQLHGLPAEYLTSYVQRVYAVTPADVQRMAQQYIDPSRIAVVIVGDPAQISDQIAPYRP